MHFLYNILIRLSAVGIKIVAKFSKKMKLFVDGRKDVFQILNQKISGNDKTIWFHCASLGEFEQGVPIMEAIKKLKPNHKIVVSFFSPSGYEIKKNTPLAEAVVYLPWDTPEKAGKFITAVHPSLVFFVKYEFWPNYLFELQKRNTPTLLVSGLFRKNQIFFKPYGGFMKKTLNSFDHFFVQNSESKLLLEKLGFKNITISGDTRFDRVSKQIEMDNTLRLAEEFKGDSICFVCGSTWPEDDAILLDYINSNPKNVKFIIAPHKIEADKIENFRKRINHKTVLHSEMKGKNLSKYSVLIIDCIGLLTRLYKYADIAYVGGAMGSTGLHNILEPATFGVPIIFGKNYDGFPEAKKLLDLKGAFSVSNEKELSEIFTKLVEDVKFRSTSGMISGDFVKNNTGATQKILQYVALYN